MSSMPSRPVTSSFLGEVRWCLLLLALIVVLSARTTAALEPLPSPEGPVLLTVDGSIAVTNNGEQADFDRAMLAELGLSEIRTTTAWTDGMQIFEGVLLASVLDRVGAKGEVILATALNDYAFPIPFEEAARFGVLLAMRMNGRELEVRDWGPLWVVYPREGDAVLQEPQYNDRWVWQLRRLTVK